MLPLLAKLNTSLMIEPKLMIEPSYWLGTGIKLEEINGCYVFKFTDDLQARSDELIERSKLALLTLEEKAELDGISELAQIFTYVNSVLAVKLQNEWDRSGINLRLSTRCQTSS